MIKISMKEPKGMVFIRNLAKDIALVLDPEKPEVTMHTNEFQTLKDSVMSFVQQGALLVQEVKQGLSAKAEEAKAAVVADIKENAQKVSDKVEEVKQDIKDDAQKVSDKVEEIKSDIKQDVKDVLGKIEGAKEDDSNLRRRGRKPKDQESPTGETND